MSHKNQPWDLWDYAFTAYTLGMMALILVGCAAGVCWLWQLVLG